MPPILALSRVPYADLQTVLEIASLIETHNELRSDTFMPTTLNQYGVSGSKPDRALVHAHPQLRLPFTQVHNGGLVPCGSRSLT